MKLFRLLVLMLAIAGQVNVAFASGGMGPGPGIGAQGGGGGIGVEVGASGILVSTADGTTPVYLTGMGVQGGEFGANWIQAIVGVTSAQWADVMGGTGGTGGTWWTWLAGNQSTTIANTYAKFNYIRIYINSAAWTGAAGADPGGNDGNPSVASEYTLVGTNLDGHLIYCAGTGCGLGTHDGTETDGIGITYQNAIDTIIQNVEGAATILGYTTYIDLNDDYTTPVLASNGQKLLPSSQPGAMSPVDLAMWTQIAAKYKGDRRVIFEFQNEPYYSVEGTGGTSLMNYESALLGNGNGSPTTFSWPNATSIGDGGTSCYYVNFGTCIAQGAQATSVVSYQQVLNAVRGQGANNLVFLGSLVNSGALYNWSQNGGTQAVTDPLTIGGHQQYAAILHDYSLTFGTDVFSNGKTGAQNVLGLIAAGTPFVLDEYGLATSVGSTHLNGYSWMKANNISGHSMTAWANFASPGTSITDIYSQGSFCMTCLNPWSNFNVGSARVAGAPSQVPNGSNLRPAPAVVRFHGHAANDDYFEQLMTGTRMY